MLQKQETDEYLNDLFPQRVRSMKTTTKPLTTCFEELVKRGRESKPDIYTSAAMRLRYGRSDSGKLYSWTSWTRERQFGHDGYLCHF